LLVFRSRFSDLILLVCQIEAAIAKFQAAKKLAPCHKFNPENKVKKILLELEYNE